MILEGLVLAGEDLQPISGYVAMEEGTIKEVVETGSGDPSTLIMPGLVNCHTHIGDYAFKDRGLGLRLEELVRSPDGLKHRLLSETDPRELSSGMAAAEQEMIDCGTTSFLDFREQGLEGVRLLKEAVTNLRSLAFGRPEGLGVDATSEIKGILDEAEGIGLDRVGAYDDETLGSIREAAWKDVGVHVSERCREPGEMERALNVLSADILVHLTHATPRDLRDASEKGCRAVICPRSNLFSGVGLPPIDTLIDEGLDVGIGTDNCMINSLDPFRDMEVALSIMKNKRPEEVLRMATIGGARAAGISAETGSIEPGKAADILVLEIGKNLSHIRDPHAAIARRAGPQNVAIVLKDGRILLDRRRET